LSAETTELASILSWLRIVTLAPPAAVLQAAHKALHVRPS
jgi:hypothetical protein